MPVKGKPKLSVYAAAASEVGFIDRLLRQSLAINPEKRGNDTTTTFLKRLRDRAVGGKSHAPSRASAEPTADQRGSATVALFLRQKNEEYEKDAASLRSREAEIAREKVAVRERHIKEIVDFLVVVSSSVSGAALADGLKSCRVLFAELGVTEAEVLRRVREAKK